MKLSCTSIDGFRQIKMISAHATYGIGLFTGMFFLFSNLFGVRCDTYDEKIDIAKDLAIDRLISKAQSIGATGVMDIHFQIHGTTVFVYGIACVEKKDN